MRRERPDLWTLYADLYRDRSYAPKAFQEAITNLVRELCARYDVGRENRLRLSDRAPRHRSPSAPRSVRRREPSVQLSLI
jgi:hypothetical protein